jgi:hypothetical protein
MKKIRLTDFQGSNHFYFFSYNDQNKYIKLGINKMIIIDFYQHYFMGLYSLRFYYLSWLTNLDSMISQRIFISYVY